MQRKKHINSITSNTMMGMVYKAKQDQNIQSWAYITK